MLHDVLEIVALEGNDVACRVIMSGGFPISEKILQLLCAVRQALMLIETGESVKDLIDRFSTNVAL